VVEEREAEVGRGDARARVGEWRVVEVVSTALRDGGEKDGVACRARELEVEPEAMVEDRRERTLSALITGRGRRSK